MGNREFYVEQLNKALQAYLSADTEFERKIEKEIIVNIINEMDNDEYNTI